MTTATKSKAKTANTPVLIAIQAYIAETDRILFDMEQPMYSSPKEFERLRKRLKDEVLRPAIKDIQENIILSNAGKPTPLKSDPVGFTTASSDYGKPSKTPLKFGHLVNIICREILDEQEQVAKDDGMVISQEGIISALNDANDDNKETVTIESLVQEDGSQSRLVVDKATGDVEVHEKGKDGVFRKVGNTFKKAWTGTKNFVKSIWNWIAKQCKRFWNWISSVFKSPDDLEVIHESLAN